MASIDEDLRPSSSELTLLNPKQIKLSRGPGDSIRMVVDDWDRSYLQVKIRKAFPLSYPEHFIGFNDGEDKEIGVIENPKELDKESLHIVRDELERRYFIPVIYQILTLRDEFGMGYWTVETDKGQREFITRGRHESLQELGNSRVIISDVDGNRYDIPNTDALDRKSYLLLSKILY